MASAKDIRNMELKIKGKMIAIRQGKTTPKDSGIGLCFKWLKKEDEPLHDQLLNEYKEVLKTLKK